VQGIYQSARLIFLRYLVPVMLSTEESIILPEQAVGLWLFYSQYVSVLRTAKHNILAFLHQVQQAF
jgi:hypothetical protein